MLELLAVGSLYPSCFSRPARHMDTHCGFRNQMQVLQLVWQALLATESCDQPHKEEFYGRPPSTEEEDPLLNVH